ncbi:VHS domain-containing protein [Phakopsora pachyrhizi]
MYGSGSRGSGPDGQMTLLESYIERACSPMLSQPNMSLNLEIADLVNMKKANTPREAAMTVIQYVNRRNTHVSMLALHLLDILVKNCGYPFHLQISTKEFLNELVRRFPEKPPVFPPPPMQKILELIHEWKLTICVTSKHKEDLVHIRDMHRLLSYKGYRFPEVDRRAAQVLNESDRLKSAEELEEEDRAAQSAKLQELIRRGTPKDLAAAQELMKIMSGAEPDKQPDYEAEMQKELDRVQSRILLLNELLNNAQPSEKFVEGDAFDQLSQKCKQVQPKLQKWIGESAENQPDMMDRLLLINDLTNNVLQRYNAFKNGDFSATAEINPAFAGRDTADAKTRAKEVSLIDFEEPDESQVISSQAKADENPLEGLLNTLTISNDQTSQSGQKNSQISGGSFFDPNPISSSSVPHNLKPPSLQYSFFSSSTSNGDSTDSIWNHSLSPNRSLNVSPQSGGAISLGLNQSTSNQSIPSPTFAASIQHSAQLNSPSLSSTSTSNQTLTTNNQLNNNSNSNNKSTSNDPFADLAGLF